MEECLIDHRGESSKERSQRTSFSQCLLRIIDRRAVGHVTIDILPNDVLLEVFFVYQKLNPTDRSWWQTLVHVCRRWRGTIFASPLHLRLVLKCTAKTPVRKSLNIWPPLPIIIYHEIQGLGLDGDDNIIAALAHRDRVTEMHLTSYYLQERFATAMRGSFPALTHLDFGSHSRMILPEAFLGESAPSLRTLVLNGSVLPALPKLLLSTSHLVTLELSRISIHGYISPEAMATCLAMLPNLEHLRFGFDSSRTHPNQTLFTRTVLPTLTSFHFEGASEYLDDFIARVDAPALQTFLIDFSGPIFRISQLYKFISRAEWFKLPTQAMVNFEAFTYIRLLPLDGFNLTISCGEGVSSMASVCQELSPFFSHVERLELYGRYRRRGQPNMDPPPWPELFHPFIAVQNLCVSTRLVPLIAPALQDLTGERAIEVLPKLRMLFLGGYQPYSSVQEAIEPFVAACQRSGHLVVVQLWSIDNDDQSL